MTEASKAIDKGLVSLAIANTSDKKNSAVTKVNGSNQPGRRNAPFLFYDSVKVGKIN